MPGRCPQHVGSLILGRDVVAATGDRPSAPAGSSRSPRSRCGGGFSGWLRRWASCLLSLSPLGRVGPFGLLLAVSGLAGPRCSCRTRRGDICHRGSRLHPPCSLHPAVSLSSPFWSLSLVWQLSPFSSDGARHLPPHRSMSRCCYSVSTAILWHWRCESFDMRFITNMRAFFFGPLSHLFANSLIYIGRSWD